MPEKDIKKTVYNDWPAYFRSCAERYGDIGIDGMYQAFTRTQFGAAYTANPFIQNRRVKAISSIPKDWGKNDIAEMLSKPDESEMPLRQVGAALEVSAYPYFKIRKTYQDLLSYRYYSAPAYLDEAEAKTDEFKREWRLVDKINKAVDPKANAHQIVGQAVKDGKCFYTLRHDIDKSHNKVNYCFMQQLPQDWVKIVGFNSLSKYTVAFNMMYFFQPGCTPTQFGDLFDPYIALFEDATAEMVKPTRKVAYGARGGVDIGKTRDIDGVEAYFQNGRWYYWVTLPADKVWTFEADDISRNVFSPLTGLMISMANISAYEKVSLELVQNPLVSIVTGEIPYDQDKNQAADNYKLSPAGRLYFEQLFYNMLAANNTGGVGFFLAPAENLKLQQLAEAPSGGEIAADGYSYAMMKSGLTAILPITDQPRAGLANISLMLESKFAEGVYGQFGKMMDRLYEELNLKHEWHFVMFGNIATDKDEIADMKKSMELGILPDVFRYNALLDRSVLDDISMSNCITGVGLLDYRVPLLTSYSAANLLDGSNKTAQPKGEPGRPATKGLPQSDGAEQDIDETGGAEGGNEGSDE